MRRGWDKHWDSLFKMCIETFSYTVKFKICSTLTHLEAIKWKSREVPLLQLLGCCVISGWEAASNLFTLFAQKRAMTPFSQFISFLFDSCYRWCLKLIQKVEYGWAAWGDRKQDCTRWDQTDDSSNSPTSLVRLNRVFLSLVLNIWFCVLTTSVTFFNCFEQHTLGLPDMINQCGPTKPHSTSVLNN